MLDILADALEAACCTDPDILGHCRSGGPHSRGCWVVDLILGKESTMTEAEWLQCRNPHYLLDFFQEMSDRKVRLFAAACCRRLWHLLTDERSRAAIEVSERFADGLASCEELDAAADRARAAAQGIEQNQNPLLGATGAAWAVVQAVRQPGLYDPECYSVEHQIAAEATAYSSLDERASELYLNPAVDEMYYRKIHEEKAVQAAIFRDIAGNPFRPVKLNANWVAPTVIKLAQAIYGNRDSDQLPILADALEAASCTNLELLNHCRQLGEHARGCWVVDLILGKG